MDVLFLFLFFFGCVCMCVTFFFIINAEATNRFYYAIKTLQYVGMGKLTSPQFVWLDIWGIFFPSRAISCWATVMFFRFPEPLTENPFRAIDLIWPQCFNEWSKTHWQMNINKHANVKSPSGTWQIILCCALSLKNSHKDEFSIVPVLVGALSESKEQEYGKLLSKYLADPSNLFIISSDFCHWGLCPLTSLIFQLSKKTETSQ